jgi:hypothetical protein
MYSVSKIGAALLVFLCLSWGGSQVAMAEPYLAVQQGYKCVQCHINPTGGGLRSVFGDVFIENVLATNPLPQGAPTWLGEVVQDVVRVGGDLRTDWSRDTTPGTATLQGFEVSQFRLYADVTLIPNLLGIYVDETVAPSVQNEEAYARLGSTSGWYVKAGQFYLPFGWRLQDQTAFVREATFINMAAPDTGVEFGLEQSKWSAQLDVTNGVTNLNSGHGYQVTTNVVRVESSWRVGASGSFTRSPAANRDQFGLYRDQFGLYSGVRTGPIAWLGEVDLIREGGFVPTGAAAGAPGIAITQIPAFVEADWGFHKGNNLKLTYELFDPERGVAGNIQTRWSIVYEVTPIPFAQVRVGFRRNEGITQVPAQNQTLAFAELHAFL